MSHATAASYAPTRSRSWHSRNSAIDRIEQWVAASSLLKSLTNLRGAMLMA